MNCPSCGEKVAPGSVFCANCGTRLPVPPATQPAPSGASATSADDTLVGVRPHSLLALAGPEKGQTFPLTKETTRLGRDLENEVVLTDPRISRHHADIELKGQDYLIFDMGTPNGLFVNAMRVTGPQVLRDGDNIRLGDTVLVFSHEPLGASERKIENISWEPDFTPIPPPRPQSSQLTESATLPPPPPPPAVVAKPAMPPPPPPPPPPAAVTKPITPPPPPPVAKPVAPGHSLDTIVEKKKAGNTRWFFMTCLLIVVLLILFAVLVWLAIPRISFSFPPAALPGS